MQARTGFARGVFALVGPSRSGGRRGNPAVARRRLAPGKKEGTGSPAPHAGAELPTESPAVALQPRGICNNRAGELYKRLDLGWLAGW